MNRLGRTLSAAAFSAASLSVLAGVGQVSAGGAPPATDCEQNGATGERLYVGGPQTAGLGITIPAGAIVTSIVVETYDDYDAIGANGFRDDANQAQEQVAILIGGVQVGGLTDDIPELGPGGDRRKASATTTVFTGSQAASGAVTVQHGGVPNSPNSVQIRKVTIKYTIPGGCGGVYPLNGEVSKTVVVTNGGTQNGGTQNGGTQTGSTGGTQNGVTDPGSGSTSANAPVAPAAPQTPAVASAPAAATPAAADPAPTGAIVPQVGSAAAAPAAAPTAAAAPQQGGNLPVTGSEPTNLVQLGAVAAAAGLGMIAVAGIRRRKAGAAS